MFNNGFRGGVIFDRSMGDGVRGGELQLDYKGEFGRDHVSVYGDGAHFSWDYYPQGDPRNENPGPAAHGTLHHPKRPW